MLRSYIDHLVITAPCLADGEQYIKQQLGVDLQPGGEHSRMGTHNRLLKLGGECYLEVIAVNPNAPAPDRPRWFQLDRSPIPIRLATWIARTNDIISAVTRSPIALGEIEAMSRGTLQWRISLLADGALPMQGIAPPLIQWNEDKHPAALLPESGCTLLKLEGFHPEADKIESMLDAIGFADHFHVHSLPSEQSPYLIAHINTPNGIKRLGDPNEFFSSFLSA